LRDLVFLANIPVLTMKILYKDQHTYRYILVENRGKLYHQTICTKALGE